MDLYAQLEELQDSFLLDTGIPCKLDISVAHTRVDAALADVIHRCVRELPDNVRKHAQATMVEITSAIDAKGSMIFTVADDGIGLPELAWRRLPKEGAGFGLWSIEHRLANYGGRLEIRGDTGVRARLILPSHHLLDA